MPYDQSPSRPSSRALVPGRRTVGVGLVLTLAACSPDSPTSPGANGPPTTPPPTAVSVTVAPSSLTLAPGGSASLTATVYNGSQAVTWTSSNPGVASVSGAGLVTAGSEGTTTVRAASVQDPSAQATAQVVVQAPSGPSPVTIVVTNQLLNAINIEVNGAVQGSVPPQSTRQTTVPFTTSLQVGWTLVRSTTNQGTPIGDVIGGDFSAVVNPGPELRYTVDAILEDLRIFRPLIVNQTSTELLMSVNGGLQSENRCNCVVPGPSSGTAIGYYRLYSNSNVRGYREGGGYTGGYIYWDNFSSAVSPVDGTIRLTATTAPAVGPSPAHAASSWPVPVAPHVLPDSASLDVARSHRR